jgi:hypothetical protein
MAMANADSAYTGQPAALPLDRAAYSEWLASLKGVIDRI